MRAMYWKIGILLINILSSILVTQVTFAGNYDRTLSSEVQFGLSSHELYVSVPSSLYDYYSDKTHSIRADREYATFVTPDAFESVAENIWNITRDKTRSYEAFANTVLQLIHQIPYTNGDVKYPVETLVENSGKCDTLSLLAASIMKAGGLDVVLLYHKEVHHINVGVHLAYEPHGSWWWLSPTGYEFGGKKYWIAECTPAMEWKVGDVPPLLKDTNPSVISLENSEESSPAYVSSKLDSPLNSCSISINARAFSSDLVNISHNEWALTISGSISPAYPNETITVYFSQNGIAYNACKTETDSWGNYTFGWNLNSTGTYYIRTSWSGNSEYAGVDSDTLTVFRGFHQSLIPFGGSGYYYTYSPTHIASNELRVNRGIEEFLDIQLSGTGVLLSGEFIILRDKQNVSSIQTQRITIPASEQLVRFRGYWVTRQIPERTTTIPVNVPEGMNLVRLPENFDLTMNNKFGFVLRNDIGDNYSVSVRGMDNLDMAQINQLSGNETIFVNASAIIRENTWYKVVARISEDEVTAEVYDANGTMLERTSATDDAKKTSELVMLIANNIDRAVAFRNLKVETLDGPVKTLPEDNPEAVNGHELLVVSYIAVIILLATTFTAMVYKKKRGSRELKSVLKIEQLRTLL